MISTKTGGAAVEKNIFVTTLIPSIRPPVIGQEKDEVENNFASSSTNNSTMSSELSSEGSSSEKPSVLPKPSNLTSETENQNVIHPKISSTEISKNLATNEQPSSLSEKHQNVDVTTSPIHTGSETSRSYQPEGKYFNYLFIIFFRKFRQKFIFKKK